MLIIFNFKIESESDIIGLFPTREKITRENKNLNNLKKHNKNKYRSKGKLKRRIKNSQIFTNVKNVADDGLIELKSGEVASLIEVKAIDLSLTSKNEKQSFFYSLKSLYQIKGLNLKCYKLDQKINLNNNKINLSDLMESFSNDSQKYELLEESKRLIEELEDNHYTISSVYYLVVIAKDLTTLEKQLDEIEEIISNINPRLNMEVIDNRLEIYNKFIYESP